MNRNTKWIGMAILVAAVAVVALSLRLAAQPVPVPSPQPSQTALSAASAEPTFLASASPSPSPEPQNSPSNQPKITWSVPELSVTMFPGTTSTTSVSFRSDEDASGIVIEATPSLTGMVSISPTNFASITANQTYQLTLTLSVPPAFQKRSFGGTIHIRSAGAPPRTYAEPLTVDLRTGWNTVVDPGSGLTIALPELGPALTISDRGPASDVLFGLDIQVSNPSDQTARSLIELVAFSNPMRADLPRWFHQHLDPDGILIGAGTFQPQQLANGLPALVNVAPVPITYQNGPVAAAYMLSSTGDRVFAVTQSQDAQLTEYGYSATEVPNVLESILGSLQ